MSSFGAKRKPRKITVQEDDDDSGLGASLNTQAEPQQQEPPPLQATFKTRKPLKQSSLRKSININDDDHNNDSNIEPAAGGGTARTKPTDNAAEDDNDEGGGAPLRVRPQLGRSASTKTKKRASTASRLSFGPSEIGAGDGYDDEDSLMLGGEVFTPKKTSTTGSSSNSSGLGQAAVENSSAYKKRIPKRNLPALGGLALRSTADGDRLYSKEYLSELQQSTPNTPQPKLSAAFDAGADGDDGMMSLDPSELEGAMVVDDNSTAVAPRQTEILTEAQIQEKKERRARFAKQLQSRSTGDDFISLSDDDNNNNNNDRRQVGDSYLSVLSTRQSGSNSSKKSESTRLVAEDEDLGEGFDAFVEDGGLSLGAKAEREARRKQRALMADLINTAEGGGGGGSAPALQGGNIPAPTAEDYPSDDSEAERHAAYEAAQTRRGMDGLAAEREAQQRRLQRSTEKDGVVPVPHRIAPLPDLSVLVRDFAEKVRRHRDEVARTRTHIAALRAERDAVARREPEVQALLDEAGERYRRAVTGGGGGGGGVAALGGSEEGDANGNANTYANGEGDRGKDKDGEDGDDVDRGGVRSADDGNAAAERAKSLLDQMRMSVGGGVGPPGTPLGARGLESLGTTPVRPSRATDEAEEL
ncbi:hypothetical protein SLS62_003014 [Diatrype stigma]|uniref:Uncharacterized protein n=1 Tax=Diatrype stigma TaxID=117547 RepID=A0AAN9UZ31_9PEZI